MKSLELRARSACVASAHVPRAAVNSVRHAMHDGAEARAGHRRNEPNPATKNGARRALAGSHAARTATPNQTDNENSFNIITVTSTSLPFARRRTGRAQARRAPAPYRCRPREEGRQEKADRCVWLRWQVPSIRKAPAKQSVFAPLTVARSRRGGAAQAQGTYVQRGKHACACLLRSTCCSYSAGRHSLCGLPVHI